jgi:hypothetical protein
MDTARSLLHLHAAYLLTWGVQLVYVIYLMVGFAEVKRESDELRKR